MFADVARRLCLSPLLLIGAAVVAAPPTPTWQNIFPLTGPARATAFRVLQDPTGNVFVLSLSYGTTAAENRIIVRKFSVGGTLLWERVYGGPTNRGANPRDMAVDSSGNVTVVGAQEGTPSTGRQSLIISWRGDGSLRFVRATDFTVGSGNEEYRRIRLGLDGTIYALGEFAGAMSQDIVVRCVNTSGSTRWTTVWTDTSISREDAIDIGLDGTDRPFVLSNSSTAWPSPTFRAALLSLRPDGTVAWRRLVDLGTDGGGQQMVVAPDGTSFFVGFTENAGAVVAFSPAGVQRYFSKYRRTGASVRFDAIALDSSLNAYVGGSSSTTTGTQAVIARYLSAGSASWARLFGAPGANTTVTGLTTDPRGNAYLQFAGASTPYQFGMARWNTSGVQEWQVNLPGPTDGNGIYRNLAGDLAVVGSRLISGAYRSAMWWLASPVTITTGSPPVTGGSAIRFRITLRTPAPVGGQLVRLSDTSRNLILPTSVTVPAGARFVDVDASTIAVSVGEIVTVSADAGTNTSSVRVTLRP